ncbi:MAG: helix-turn-helix transcriptional regulator [Marinobacter sp.]|nr:helix-turn-helix transcriptional regulator [Marinobacter sp.]
MQTFDSTEFTARNKGNLFTKSQLETLAWMAEGKENAAIGMLRGHGEPGAKKLVAQVMVKLHCNNRSLAVSRAFAAGYLIAKANAGKVIAIFLLVISSWLAVVGDDHDLYRRTNGGTRITRTGGRTTRRLDEQLNNWLEVV